MGNVIEFLGSRNGRITRVVVGVILLIIGLAIGFNVNSDVGWVITVISLFPLVGAALDLVFIAPFFGKSLSGARLRSGEEIADPLEELEILQPDIDEKNKALLGLMRYWLFGTFLIVSAAVYTYAFKITMGDEYGDVNSWADGDLVEAWNNTYIIIGAIAVLCVITFFIYWIFVTRIRVPRQLAASSETGSPSPVIEAE